MPTCRGLLLLLLMAAGLMAHACAHTEPLQYGAPLPPRPARHALTRTLAPLQQHVQSCWDSANGVGPKPLVMLEVLWPAVAPIVFRAQVSPEDPALARCAVMAARDLWVRAFKDVPYARTSREVTLFFRVR